jgi:DNA-nicking Smr family endonuclease
VAERRLNPDEAALWRRVIASVRPIGPARAVLPSATVGTPPLKARPVVQSARPAAPSRVLKPAPRAAPPGVTLDGGWDHRLSRGMVSPDRTVDLHGMGLHAAHMTLDGALERAIARGERVVLLVTGKPPRAESERPHARGAIRAAIADWLAASRHADRIAAVRGAHPRHGGLGALYIVLRRPRTVS